MRRGRDRGRRGVGESEVSRRGIGESKGSRRGAGESERSAWSQGRTCGRGRGRAGPGRGSGREGHGPGRAAEGLRRGRGPGPRPGAVSISHPRWGVGVSGRAARRSCYWRGRSGRAAVTRTRLTRPDAKGLWARAVEGGRKKSARVGSPRLASVDSRR